MSPNESSKPNPFRRLNRLVTERPKLLFRTMVITIIVSIILTIALEITEKPLERKRFAPAVSHGISDATGSLSTLSEVISLKSEISLLLGKDTLSHTDSVRLLEAFQKLEKMNRKLNPDKQ